MLTSRYLTSARVLVSSTLAATLACGYDSPPVTQPRVLTTVDVTVPTTTLELGETITATASGFDQDGEPLDIGPVAWTAADGTIAAISPSGLIFGVAPGTTEIRATVDGRVGRKVVTVTTSPGIRINEIAPTTATRAGWIELFNPTADAVDLANWTLTDSNIFVSFRFAAGTSIPARGFLVLDQVNLPFVVDAQDDAHFFSGFGVQVDAATWTIDPARSFGRCPDGGDTFVTLATRTKGTTDSSATRTSDAGSTSAPARRRAI